ncbi:helix-turn-helix transcriptional regulator [Kibdelosporangium persicum]|uniref:Transcriptional regulator n=1 Tax=Kibdelosporangium persicum TaxID=2698649 RepID=A0ABX2F6Q3_9PSEU|nr:helix-turn-helix transcriptional regulator [Kibdelosporangium persicum]NRN66616.1 Transcriptional regulator [Kibdelosporangium persicum]
MQRQNVNSRGIGMELARHRRVADMTLEQVSRQLGMSVSTLSRLENGKREPTSEEVAGILAVLGVTGGDRQHLLQQVRCISHFGMVLGKAGPRTRTYQAFEAEAVAITNFELSLVPGLAQTADYARAVISAVRVNASRADVEARVSQRMSRKAVLTRKRPPQVNLLMTELALRQPIGGPKVMANQIRSLVALADQENVSLHVIPATVPAHAGLGGSFVLFDFADHPTLVFIEALTTGLYRDDPDDVATYRLQVENLDAVALDKSGSVELMRSISRDMEGRASGPDMA